MEDGVEKTLGVGLRQGEAEVRVRNSGDPDTGSSSSGASGRFSGLGFFHPWSKSMCLGDVASNWALYKAKDSLKREHS